MKNLKRILTLGLVVMLTVSNIGTIYAAEPVTKNDISINQTISDEEKQELEELIEKGKNLNDSNSTESYNWVLNVKKYNETHKNNEYYEKLKSECDEMINYSVYKSDKNKTIAYLMALQGKYIIDIDEIIKIGNDLTDTESVNVDSYLWVISVSKYNENNLLNSLYDKIKYESEEMINYSVYESDKNRVISIYSGKSNWRLFHDNYQVYQVMHENYRGTQYNNGHYKSGFHNQTLWNYKIKNILTYIEKHDKLFLNEQVQKDIA